MQGHPYGEWEPEVPRIPPNILDCSIYLYPTNEAAESGLSAGGSGFLLGVHTTQWQLYAVTNSHVVREGRSTVVRLNTRDGQFDVLNTDDASWFHHPRGDDLAVCPVTPSNAHRFAFVTPDRLLTLNHVSKNSSVVPGMDVFMVGRCVTRDGKQRNTPSVRIGGVSQLPEEPIPHFRGDMLDCFLVDMRSVGGYSGSPAFVFIQYLEIRGVPLSVEPSGLKQTLKEDWMLLGVNWGHLPQRQRVYEAIGKDVLETNYFIQENLGMACIAPAWKLAEMLDDPSLKRLRDEADNRGKQLEGGAVID